MRTREHAPDRRLSHMLFERVVKPDLKSGGLHGFAIPTDALLYREQFNVASDTDDSLVAMFYEVLSSEARACKVVGHNGRDVRTGNGPVERDYGDAYKGKEFA